MKTKKRLTILVALFFISFLFGCDVKKPSFQLNVQELSVEVGEEKEIKATVKNTEEALDWSVDDESVIELTVDSGKLKATVKGLSKGEAKVTVKLGEETKVVDVEVTETEVVEPELFIPVKTLAVKVDGTININAVVKVDSKVVDATITYTIADDTVVSVSNQGIIKGLKLGETTVTVQALYLESELEAEISVSVTEDVVFALDVQELELYSIHVDDAKTNVYQVSATLKVDGEDKDVSELVWSTSNAEVATVENGLITALHPGTATITATFTTPGGQTINQTIDLTVNLATVSFETPLDVEYRLSTVIDLDVLELTAEDITKVYNVTDDLEYDFVIEDGDQFELDLSELDEHLIYGVKILNIETKEIIYQVEVHFITKKVMNAADFNELPNIISNFGGAEAREVAGYYVLGNNIDYSGYNFKTIGVWNDPLDDWTKVFEGVLDGRGYAVSNIVFTGNNTAMFACLSEDAVIKNIAFVDAKIGFASATLAIQSDGALLENIFVSGTLDVGAVWCPSSLLVSKVYTEIGTLRNIVINVQDMKGGTTGSNGALLGGLLTDAGDNFNNILVIGTEKVAGIPSGEPVALEGVDNFATLVEYLASETYDLSRFDNEFWVVEEGFIPILKNQASFVEEQIRITNEEEFAYLDSTLVISTPGNEIASYQISPDTVGVSVDEDGVVSITEEAVVGSKFNVIVTSVYGGITATKEFEVDEVIIKPTIEVAAEEVSLFVGDTEQIVVTVKLEDEIVDDAGYKYEVANDNVVSVSAKGLLTALARGTTEVTVKTTYNGFEISVDFTVVVSEDVLFAVNPKNVTLYAVFVNEEQTNQKQLDVTFKIDGQDGNLNDILWESSDTEVVTVENGLLTAVAVGEAVITAKYENEDEAILEQKINVTVLKATLNVETALDLEYNEDSKLDFSQFNILADDVVSITNQTDETEFAFTVEEDAVALDLTEIAKEKLFGVKAVTIDSLNLTLNVEIHFITKKVMNADDFASLSAIIGNFYGADVRNTAGYYVLGADIDFAGHAFETIGIWSDPLDDWTKEFNGILDGRGYTISNYVVEGPNGAIFARMGPDAVVKNIAFDNASVGWAAALISIETAGATFENIYIKGSLAEGAVWCPSSLLVSKTDFGNSVFRNIVIQVDQMAAETAGFNGVLIGSLRTPLEELLLDNVLIIGSQKGISNPDGVKIIVEDIDTFATIEEFLELEDYDYSGFSEERWVIVEGIPQLKN